MSVLVDARWDGNFGIGRFGREVRARLSGSGVVLHESTGAPLELRELASLRRAMKKAKVNAFYSPGFTGSFRVRNCPQLLTVWDLTHLNSRETVSAGKRVYYSKVVKPAILQSGSVMTGSAASALELIDWLGPAGRVVDIQVVGCGISRNFIRTGVEKVEVQLLFVSNLQSHKNMETVLNALAKVDNARAVWVIQDQVAARRAIKDAGVESQVRVVSNLSDSRLAELYSRSAALVFPSRHEGFGLPPVEAMACGTRVIYAEECAPVRETCEHVPGNIGVSSFNSVEEWATAMEHVLQHPVRVEEFDSTNYSWDAVAGRVQSVLASYSDDIDVTVS